MRLAPLFTHRFPGRACISITRCTAQASARAQTLEWVRQLGTSEGDSSYAVSADGLGNVYISGLTEGGLRPAPATAAFVAKYAASSKNEELQWVSRPLCETMLLLRRFTQSWACCTPAEQQPILRKAGVDLTLVVRLDPKVAT